MTENIALRTARRHVQFYQDEYDDLKRHKEGLERRDCEAYLQLGIDAFHWLRRADLAIRGLYADGKLEYSKELDDSIQRLAKAWLASCADAEKWIAIQESRQSEIDNAAEFRNCVEEMRAIVKFYELSGPQELPAQLVPLRDQAIEELRNGETSPFV